MVINLGGSEISLAIEIELSLGRVKESLPLEGSFWRHWLSATASVKSLHIYSTALCFYDLKCLLEENFDWSLPDPSNFMEILAILAW